MLVGGEAARAAQWDRKSVRIVLDLPVTGWRNGSVSTRGNPGQKDRKREGGNARKTLESQKRAVHGDRLSAREISKTNANSSGTAPCAALPFAAGKRSRQNRNRRVNLTTSARSLSPESPSSPSRFVLKTTNRSLPGEYSQR